MVLAKTPLKYSTNKVSFNDINDILPKALGTLKYDTSYGSCCIVGIA